MAFLVVYELSPEATEEQRLGLRDAHRAYIERHVGGLVAQVSRMFSEDGSQLVGGYVLLNTAQLDEARAFYENDPYVTEGVWSSVVFGSVDLPGPVGPGPAGPSK